MGWNKPHCLSAVEAGDESEEITALVAVETDDDVLTELAAVETGDGLTALAAVEGGDESDGLISLSAVEADDKGDEYDLSALAAAETGVEDEDVTEHYIIS